MFNEPLSCDKKNLSGSDEIAQNAESYRSLHCYKIIAVKKSYEKMLYHMTSRLGVK